jgi:hypothetical protein
MGFHWGDTMAYITVRRPSAMGDKMRKYRVFVDGVGCRDLAEGDEVRIAVTPGSHVVRMKIDWCWSPPLTVDVEEGAERLLECGPNANPFLVLVYITFLKDRYLWLRHAGTTALPLAA